MINRRNLLFYALLILAISWAPWVEWGLLRKVVEPWAAITTILATAVSPLIAVQVTKILDAQRQVQDEKLRIFRALMEFRAARMLSTEYARALSLIDVVFCGESSQEKAIRDAFGKHAESLVNSKDNSEQMSSLHELLYLMSEHVGINISRQTIAKNGIYPAWIETQLVATMNNTNLNADLMKLLVNLANNQASANTSIPPQQNTPPASV